MKEKFGTLFLYLVLATMVASFFRFIVFENYRISTDAMSPALVEGDMALIFKPIYNFRIPFSNSEIIRFREPKEGDIVAFALPDELFSTVIKRVVALGGQRVAIRGGKLMVNEQAATYRSLGKTGDTENLEEQHAGATYAIRQNTAEVEEYGPIDVPNDHFFALSDSRNGTTDSRTWGPIPYSCLRGRLGLVWWKH